MASFWLVSTIARTPRPTGRGVDAGNLRRALDVAHPTVEHRLRTAEHQAVVYAADPKPIAAAAKGERAPPPERPIPVLASPTPRLALVGAEGQVTLIPMRNNTGG